MSEGPTRSEPPYSQRLRAVLSSMGIRYACFVDDAFSADFATTFTNSRRAGLEGKAEELTEAWGCGTWAPDTEEDDRADSQQRWDALDPLPRLQLSRRVRDIAGAPEATHESGLTEKWPRDACPLDAVAPEEFDEKYIKEKLLARGPAVLFIDLGFGPGKETGGLDVLAAVQRTDVERKTISVIFTSYAPGDPQGAVDFWDDLVSKHGIDEAAAVVIGKAAASDGEEFEGELRRAFLNALSPGVLRWAKAITEAALKAGVAKMKIEGDVLNAAVLKSSEKEGVHPTETLFRLIDNELRAVREDLAMKPPATTDFVELGKKLEALAAIAPRERTEKPLSARVKKLRNAELYRRTLTVAGSPPPIWLGDLLEITSADDTKMQCVAIAQPCDIILRNDGTRSQDWIVVAPIKKEKGSHPELVVELKYYDDAKYESRWVYLKRGRIANVNVLDLVSLGWGEFEKASVTQLRSLGHVHASVSTRARRLADWLEGALALEKPERHLALFLDGEGPAAKLTLTPTAVNFHCKRLGRVEPELARAILQRYGNFVSRNALPHDFAEFE